MASAICVVVAGMHRSGTSLVAGILARAGFNPPPDLLPPHSIDNSGGYFESREVVRINNGFLAALGRSWSRPEPPSAACFRGFEAIESREKIRGFLEQCEPGNGLLLKDPRLCLLMPLWLPELQSRFERLVVVQVLRRADAVFRSLSRRAERPETAKAAVTCASQSDLLWLHYNLELYRFVPGGRRLTIAYEDLLRVPETTTREASVKLSRMLLQELRLPLTLPRQVAPAKNGKLISDRDRVLEAIYQALLDSTDENAAYLDVAWKHLQTRVPDAHQDQTESADARLFYRARLRQFTSKCGYVAEFPPASSIGFLVNKLRRSVRLAPTTGLQGPPILFISGDPTTRGHLYRVKNAVEGLQRLGMPSCWMSVDTLKRYKIEQVNARCIVIYRCVDDPAITRLLDWCKRKGMPVGFDIDDLIFDAELIRRNDIHFISELPPSNRCQWLQRALSYRRVMEVSDFCVVPTPTLADQVRRIHPHVRVIESGFNPQVLALSDFWRRCRSAGEVVRIGYASGTATHEADFETVVRPLAEILLRHPDLRFTLVGSLDLRPYEGLLPSEKVEVRPLVEHVNLACELARFDVNMIPLQSGSAFCDAKSPLKYFEAALVGVPSIAVKNPVYTELIQHGENGLLAHSEDEWLVNLEMLSGDERERERLSTQAREDCIARFSAERLAEKYLRLPI